MFGDHPVGRPVIGTAQSVSSMTRTQLHSFHVRRYTPERMVVAVAGNVDHDEVVALVREHFGPHLVRGRRPIAPRKGAGRVTGRPGFVLGNRDAEQTHVSLGVRTPGRSWEHRWALSVLHTALGGGLSSRLFQEVRELRGLAYSVYSTVDIFADSGALSVYAACQPERFAEVMQVTNEVLESVARDGITEAECRIAKGSLRGGLVLGLEDSSSRMSRIGPQRTELRQAPQHRAHPAADRRSDRRGGQRGRPPAAEPALRRRRSGSVCLETVTAPTTSGDGKLAPMVLGFWDIMVPIVGAPMAGGPGTPDVGRGGVQRGRARLRPRRVPECGAARRGHRRRARGHHRPARASTCSFPNPASPTGWQLDYYAEELEEIADYYQVEVGHPHYGDDDDWERKLEVVADVRPELVSFTFGVPAARRHSRGWGRWACW